MTFLDASRVWNALKEEASIWNVRASIYDYEKNALFSSAEAVIPSKALEHTIRQVRNKQRSGVVSLPAAKADDAR